MGIRFERIMAQAKVEVVNVHNRTGGTFVRFETLDILIPAKKEFRSVWADVHADWMKVTKGNHGKSTVEVVLLMSKNSFRDRFPEAVLASDNHKLHEKFKNNQRFYKPAPSRGWYEERRLYA